MTENVTGYNWRLYVGQASGTSLPAPSADTFTEVPDVEELTLPEGTREEKKYKVLTETTARTKIGSTEYSALTGVLIRDYDSAAQDQLEDEANGAAVRRNYRVIASDTSAEQRDFVGYSKKFSIQTVKNDGEPTRVALEIAVDGAVTITR